MVGLIIACCACTNVSVRQQASAEKIEKVQAIGQLLDMPLTLQCIQVVESQMQDWLPDMVLAEYGKRAKLNKNWKPGNPHYDKARKLVIKTFQQEEESSGKPLFHMEIGEAAPFFAEYFSDSEIDSITWVLKSEYGRQAVRAADSMVVPDFEKEMIKAGPLSPENRDRLEKLKLTGQDTFSEIVSQQNTLEKKYPKEAAAFNKICSRLSESLGERLGERMLKSTVSRAAKSLYRISADLSQIAQDFRNSETTN
jgi:hypothetical protein